MLWLRRDLAVGHPYALDKMLTATGLAKSLTEARRLIADGAVYVNNVKMVPPEEGFLPVVVIGVFRVDEYVALGVSEDLAGKILADPSST